MLVPLILSGGAGTRLWPISRQNFPKPFMPLADGENLLQKTMRRALALPGVTSLLTVTNRDYYFQTRDAYAELAEVVPAVEQEWLLEPMGRNTAPAIACAALHVAEHHGADTVMLVLPADHLINDQDAFASAVVKAVQMADQDYLVTFGIAPTRPETGFGYIRTGISLGDGQYAVARFVEKPDAATAQGMLADGGYLWNSGMFCFKAGVVLSAFERWAPELLAAAHACYAASQTQGTPLSFAPAAFEALPDVSFDYAVMEHTDKAIVVAGTFDWSDIGSWEAVAQLCTADPNGNRAEGEIIVHDSRNCYLRSAERLIAAVGVDDLLVIDTPDALLIAHRDKAQDVKHIVARLKENNHPLHRLHRTVHRPWGTYTVLETGERFKIKRIVVKPGASLSSQMHYHRNEHWIVVSGTAWVVRDKDEFMLLTNQSTYIEAGTRHRLENPGIVDLVMIEVQSGEYLGEDDIVRFADNYGRN